MQERQEFVEIIEARKLQRKKFKGLETGWLLSVAMIGLVIGGLVGGLLGAFVPLPGGFFIGAQVGVVLGSALGFGIGLAACCITNLFSKQSKGYNVLGLGTGTTMIGLVIGSFLGSFILPGVGNIVGSLVGGAIGLGVTLVPACLTYIGTELVACFGKPKNDGFGPDKTDQNSSIIKQSYGVTIDYGVLQPDGKIIYSKDLGYDPFESKSTDSLFKVENVSRSDNDSIDDLINNPKLG